MTVHNYLTCFWDSTLDTTAKKEHLPWRFIISTVNLFIFRGDTLITPGKTVLSEITRKVVLKITAETFKAEIRDISLDQLLTADEVFITGTNKEIVPVVKVDDITIANGKPGRRTQAVREKFAAYTAELAKSYWGRYLFASKRSFDINKRIGLLASVSPGDRPIKRR